MFLLLFLLFRKLFCRLFRDLFLFWRVELRRWRDRHCCWGLLWVALNILLLFYDFLLLIFVRLRSQGYTLNFIKIYTIAIWLFNFDCWFIDLIVSLINFITCILFRLFNLFLLKHFSLWILFNLNNISLIFNKFPSWLRLLDNIRHSYRLFFIILW